MPNLWKPEPQLLQSLIQSVPGILASQKPNGQFGTEPWICHDQQVVLPLAAAWSLEGSPFCRDCRVLDAIVRGGDALIDAQDEQGMWTFRKKDHSTWGQILMPWTYSRWIRAYQIVREAMPEEARRRWDKGLLLGFEGISRTCLGRVHNIPTHHAMALYCAGIVFGRQDWKTQAQQFMQSVVEKQSPHGWWSEHLGPVVAYNFVYSDALGVYHAQSGDGRVMEALERAARFHASYTYPDGSAVETVDERNPYHAGLGLGNPGFSYSAPGRGYLQQQHALYLQSGRSFDADYAASMLLYAGQGETEPTAAGRDNYVHRMGDDALVLRCRPWFISLSAFVCEPPQNRWVQDRQNLCSVFHDAVGLVIGGGNTKLQPLWSNFTVGDVSCLRHTPGDAEPDLRPRLALIHVPGKATIETQNHQATLTLQYAEETCRIRVQPAGDRKLCLVCEATTRSGRTVEGHITLLPHLDKKLTLSSGTQVQLKDERLDVTGLEWVEHAGWRLSLPAGSRLLWPVLPHNPYRKGGEAMVDEARLVVVLPFSVAVERHELALEVR
jgi:hypothetical protein